MVQRFTSPIESGGFGIAEHELTLQNGVYTGAAADKLAAFEELYEKLAENQTLLSKKLEELRLQGKKNSVRFRELMGCKLTEQNLLSLFQLHGLG